MTRSMSQALGASAPGSGSGRPVTRSMAREGKGRVLSEGLEPTRRAGNRQRAREPSPPREEGAPAEVRAASPPADEEEFVLAPARAASPIPEVEVFVLAPAAVSRSVSPASERASSVSRASTPAPQAPVQEAAQRAADEQGEQVSVPPPCNLHSFPSFKSPLLWI